MNESLLGKFGEWKIRIGTVLEQTIKASNKTYARVHRLGSDVSRRIVEFAQGGKMLRGGLVCLADGLVSGTVHEDSYKAAAAVELFQSALLIHDDIMDRDFTRRGAPSVFHQYQEMAQRSYIDDFYHLGESLGICAGDIAFFLGFEMLASLQNPSLLSLFALSARELSYVGIAQMADVLRGSTRENIPAETPIGEMLETDNPEKAVLDVYRYKTGRYTFSLPLMMGATIAGADGKVVRKLELLGEDLGILFQLKDDEIGIFGDESETGKPVGSDIREGKKTLFYVYLLETAQGEERERFAALLGRPELSDKEVDYVVELFEDRGVRSRVVDKANALAAQARTTISELTGLDSAFTGLLDSLVDYNLNRTK